MHSINQLVYKDEITKTRVRGLQSISLPIILANQLTHEPMAPPATTALFFNFFFSFSTNKILYNRTIQ